MSGRLPVPVIRERYDRLVSHAAVLVDEVANELDTWPGVHIERRADGAGKWRGGLGEELVLRPLDDAIDPTHLLTLSGSAGRMRNPAQGLLGGLPGSVASIHVGTYALAPTASPSAQLKAGETLSLRLPGGGGYGPPSERDRTSVARDVKNGYVSPEQAVALYGYHE